ncbi:hypothetical protein [Mesorhizobium sp. M0408]|uniref:hypothetical protein n=1 Tax=Mesorhizobium sp. M0408 TaxID=2956942 RepID=UPI00333A9F28
MLAGARSAGSMPNECGSARMTSLTSELVNEPGREMRDRIQSLLAQGRRDECLATLKSIGRFSSDDATWLSNLASEAMGFRELWLAGEYAHLLAALRWGSKWYPSTNAAADHSLPLLPTDVFLTVSKLQHDVEQFLYLQNKGLLGPEFSSIIGAYRATVDNLKAKGIEGQVPLDDEARRTIGHVYNRIVHARYTPRVTRALSDSWSSAAVENQYVNTPPGLVVIDNFLSDEALKNLRLFCLESTVWSGNRYAHGRLGAFLFDGFNCPLLLQIAEELRDRMPSIIGYRYPLRQLWGFKNAPHLPGNSTTHADFAAVNVNFWITPTEANLDERTGGLVVYDVDAPLDWSFEMYNSSPELIRFFLNRREARSVTIPYRANRAIIFNSDVFHATAEVQFRPEYENRRINITMLYGERGDDVHHRDLSGTGASADPRSVGGAWRSQAFAIARRTRR